MVNGNNFFDMTRVMADFRVPTLDVDAMVASQRKTIEALTQANQVAVEGVQAVARRQAEMARQTIEDFTGLLREIAQPGTPEEKLAKQAEAAKTALEKGVANARELAELVAKANSEAFNVLNKRVAEGLDEVRDYAKKRAAAAK
jgi:phasin family protein